MGRPERTYSSALKSYFPLSWEEIRGLLITILVIAFIISFKEWGGATFDWKVGLRNLFNAFLLSTLSVIVFVSSQRMFGIRIGYAVEFKPWMIGILFALFAAFISFGNLWVLPIGGFIVYHLAGHRLGYFRYGINYTMLGMIALMGSLASLGLAAVFKFILILAPANPLVQKMIILNVAIAITNMLPIPPLAGSHLMYASRMGYVFCFIGVVAAGVLLMLTNVWYALLGALLVAIVSWAGYYIFVERKIIE